MKRGIGIIALLAAFLLIGLVTQVTAFNYNATKHVNNFTTDIDWTNSVNITLLNNNASAACNASGKSVYIALNETMTINATTITPTFTFNASTRGNTNFSINGGKNSYNNVTSGTQLAWNHTGQPTNLLVRVEMNCENDLVAFNGLNLSYGVNVTTTAIGNINTVHRNTTGIGYFAFLNATTNASVNPQPVIYTTNDSTSTVTINSTGAMSIYDNVTNSAWLSLNACATLLETQSCRAFVFNLTNNAFRGVSVNLSPTADPNVGDTITCTSGGVDDDNDQIATTFYTWFSDGTELTNRASSFVPEASHANTIITCRSTLYDGNLNSTHTNSTGARVKGNTGGGSGSGGAPRTTTTINPPITPQPTNVQTPAPQQIQRTTSTSSGEMTAGEKVVDFIVNFDSYITRFFAWLQEKVGG